MNTARDLSSRLVFHQQRNKTGETYWYILLVVYLIAIITMFVVLKKDLTVWSVLLLFVGIAAYNAIFLHNLLVREQVIITHDAGIEYQGPKYRMASSWGDLHVATNRPLFLMILPSRLRPTRLISRKPVIARNIWVDRYLDPIWSKTSYFIPLGAGIWQGYDELLQEIKKRRPDLDVT